VCTTEAIIILKKAQSSTIFKKELALATIFCASDKRGKVLGTLKNSEFSKALTKVDFWRQTKFSPKSYAFVVFGTIFAKGVFGINFPLGERSTCTYSSVGFK